MEDENKTKAQLIEELTELRKKVSEPAHDRAEHLNRVLRGIRDVNQLIVTEKDRDALIRRACEILIETRGYQYAWIALTDDSGVVSSTAEAGLGESFASLKERMAAGDLPVCCRRALESDGVVVIDDPLSSCDDCPLTSTHSGGTSGVTVRIEHAGKLFGALGLAVRTSHGKDPEEISLVKELAGDLGLALHGMQAEGALRLKNQVFEDSIAALSIADTDGIITEVNPAFLALWGYGTKEDAIGGSVGSFFVNEEDAGPVLEALGSSGRWEGEFLARRADGPTFISRGLATAMKNERGELIGYQSANLDVTEQKAAEDQIRKYRDHLEELVEEQTAELKTVNRELEAFSYSVSHDLRAPLRGIDGFSKALLDDYQDKMDDTGKDYINRVRAGAQRMGTLIDDLLKMSRLTRSEMRHQRMDLGELAKKIAAELRQEEPDRRVDFEITAGVSAHGDLALMTAALENLLRNAWKFTGLREQARIELGVTEQKGERVYYVRDDGAGFDMAFVDKLFGAFQRLHDTTEFPGTGIGLAIVKRVILRHGGRVWAEGEVGKGATFYFTLPTTPPTADEGADS